MNRRHFLQGGLAGILVAGVAPAIIRSGVLMPVKPAVPEILSIEGGLPAIYRSQQFRYLRALYLFGQFEIQGSNDAANWATIKPYERART